MAYLRATLVALAALTLGGCIAIPISGGGAPVQVTAAGAASCPATTEAENARAAALVSQMRQAAGGGAVQPNAAAARAAAVQACNMAKRGRLAHTAMIGGPTMRLQMQGRVSLVTAENIGAGPRWSLDQVMRAWADSPSHAANLRNPLFGFVGVARAVAADGKTVFWSAVLAN